MLPALRVTATPKYLPLDVMDGVETTNMAANRYQIIIL